MSWLVIDAGNTAVKWAHSDARGNRFIGTGVEYRLNLQPLAARLAAAWRLPRPTAAFACSVADDETMQAIERAVEEVAAIDVQWLRAQPHFAGRGPGYGLALINGYRDPLQLGADRWHAMIAACAKYPNESLVVATSGTATTVDCVRGEAGKAALFLGGVIAPGFDLMVASLARGTARLPLADGRVVAHPDNTEDAIATGTANAQIGLIERVARGFSAELADEGRPPPRLLLSGGRARSLFAALGRHLLAERVVTAVSIEDNLVLRGVALRAHAEAAEAPRPAA
ncbi:MAG: type III pantothenate kinase [Pseudomonadota bacterium]